MSFLDKFKKQVWNKDSVLDNWVHKKLNAYGWRGFVATIVLLGSGYTLFRYSPEIIMFFGGDKLLPDQVLTHQVRLFVVHKIGTAIFVFLVIRLIHDYASKEKREAHQEKKRKDTLIEAEIIERKQETLKK